MRNRPLPVALLTCAAFILACMAKQVDTFDAIYVEGESIQRLSVLTANMDMCVDPVAGRTGAPLVFACKMGENWDLYLKRSAHTEATQRLGGHAADDVEPALSPSGDKVVFASNRSGNFDLFTMSTGGATAVRQLTDSPQNERCPDWSPDGSKIAFHQVSEFDQQSYIWLKELDTNALVQIGPGRCPRFAPNSKRLAYYRATDASPAWFSVWTVDLDGRNNIQVAGGSEWGAVHVTWSPAGDYLMFVSDKGLSGRRIVHSEETNRNSSSVSRTTQSTTESSSKNLWVVKPDGSRLTQVTQHPRDDYQPWWAGNGTVYFTSKRDRKTRLWSMVPVIDDLADDSQGTGAHWTRE